MVRSWVVNAGDSLGDDRYLAPKRSVSSQCIITRPQGRHLLKHDVFPLPRIVFCKIFTNCFHIVNAVHSVMWVHRSWMVILLLWIWSDFSCDFFLSLSSQNVALFFLPRCSEYLSKLAVKLISVTPADPPVTGGGGSPDILCLLWPPVSQEKRGQGDHFRVHGVMND